MEYVPNFHQDENRNSIEELFHNQWIPAYRAASGEGLDRADAEDATQTAIEELLKQPGTLRSPHSERMIRLRARWRGRDLKRKRRRQLQQEESLTQWDESPSTGDPSEDTSHRMRTPEPLKVPHPVERVIELERAKQQVAKVEAIVRGWSRRRQHIYGQCIVRKRPYMEVAKELRMSYGALRNEVPKIKKLLRKAVFGA